MNVITPNKRNDYHLKTINKLFKNVDEVFSTIQRISNVDRTGWQNFKKIKVFVDCLQNVIHITQYNNNGNCIKQVYIISL